MRLEKEGNYSEAQASGSTRWPRAARVARISRTAREECVYPRLDQRVYLRFERLPLRWVGEDLGGYAPPLRRIGQKFVYDVVGVNRLDAELVKIT